MRVKIEIDSSLESYDCTCMINGKEIAINELITLDIENNSELIMRFLLKNNDKNKKCLKSILFSIFKPVIFLFLVYTIGLKKLLSANEFINIVCISSINEEKIISLKYKLNEDETSIIIDNNESNIIFKKNETRVFTNEKVLSENKKEIIRMYIFVYSFVNIIALFAVIASIFQGNFLFILISSLICIFLVIILICTIKTIKNI